tara:strand:+ start:1541 stop:1732 length:192 start_codon:yes stop_codon:yes gene_type:complete
MMVGDLVRHKKFLWIGHVMSVELTDSRLVPGVYDEVYIVEVAKVNGARNRWASIDLEVINDSR